MAGDTTNNQRVRTARMAAAFTHLFVSEDFYEPIERYRPQPTYRDLVAPLLPLGWRMVQGAFWTQAVPPDMHLPLQGWKIHVSGNLTTAEGTLHAAVRTCVRLGIAFKFTSDPFILKLINSKAWDRGNSGKLMTVYPQHLAEFHTVIAALAADLAGRDGPYILSDRRYQDSRTVYYRYGGIRPNSRQEVSGYETPLLLTPDLQEVPDFRTPYFNPPAWASDPFPAEDDDDSPLLNGRYEVQDAIKFSNTGGVYTALDTQTGRQVLIKEARPATAADEAGNDGISLLQKEWRLLQLLDGLDIAPAPLDFFTTWEHAFLVQEFLPGAALAHHAASTSWTNRVALDAAGRIEWFEQVRQISLALAQLLRRLHEQDVVFGDFSLGNVMLIQDAPPELRLIDFEGAVQNHVDLPIQIVTPGFTTRDRMRRPSPTRSDDLYALGACMLSLFMPVTVLSTLVPSATAPFVAALAQDLGLPTVYTDLIARLMSPDPLEQPPLEQVIAALTAPDLRVEPLPHPRIRAERASAADLQRRADELMAYTLAAADFTRRDRLFPPAAGAANPLSLDHGALGVALTLQKIHGDVPTTVRRWVEARELHSHPYVPGLFSGLSGMAWAYHDLGMPDLAADALRRAQLHPLLYRHMDLYYGCAGHGLAQLAFWSSTGDADHLRSARTVADLLIQRARTCERGLSWPETGAYTRLGYAHGASGVALFLLYLHAATGEDAYLRAGRSALAYDLSFAAALIEPGVTSFPEDNENAAIVSPYWKHGSAGIGMVALRYWAATGDVQYRDVAEQAALDAGRKYTLFPGLFHGLAGLGQFTLDCHQFLGDDRYLDLAHVTASGLKLYETPKPGGLAMPGDFLHRFSTDLGTGSAGVALFYHRLRTGQPNPLMMLDHLLRPVSATAPTLA